MTKPREDLICPICNVAVSHPVENSRWWRIVRLCPSGHRLERHVYERPLLSFLKGFGIAANALLCNAFLIDAFPVSNIVAGLAVFLVSILFAKIVCDIAWNFPSKRRTGLSKLLATRKRYRAAGALVAYFVAAVLYWRVAHTFAILLFANVWGIGLLVSESVSMQRHVPSSRQSGETTVDRYHTHLHRTQMSGPPAIGSASVSRCLIVSERRFDETTTKMEHIATDSAAFHCRMLMALRTFPIQPGHDSHHAIDARSSSRAYFGC